MSITLCKNREYGLSQYDIQNKATTLTGATIAVQSSLLKTWHIIVWSITFISLPRPLPPLECIKGPQVCSHFLGKGGTLGAFVSGRYDFLRKPGKGGGFFVKSQWLPIPEIGGISLSPQESRVQLMGNDHRCTLIV